MSDLQKAKKEYEKIENDKLSIVSIAKLVTYKNELEKMIGDMDGVLIDDFKAMFDIWDNGTSDEREDTLEIMIDKSQEILEKYHGKPIEDIIK